MKDAEKTLLTFPCEFTIKVFGRDLPEFAPAVFAIIRQYAPDTAESALQTRPSANGKYVALSITIHATSKAQLDRIYQALSSSPDVVMAL